MIYNPYAQENEWEQDYRDYENMKEMYPAEVRNLSELVEEECSRFEYAGSFMYDVYPDRLTLNRMCDRVCDRAVGCTIPKPHMRQLVEVLLYNEIFRRRCNGRKCRRFWNFGL